MTRTRRFAGITATVLVALAMVAGLARLHASTAPAAGPANNDGPLTELVPAGVDPLPDVWVRPDQDRHRAVGAPLPLALLGTAVLLVVALAATGSVSGRVDSMRRERVVTNPRDRAPPLATTA